MLPRHDLAVDSVLISSFLYSLEAISDFSATYFLQMFKKFVILDKIVENLIGVRKTFDYENIPTAIFSSPEFATVGLSEEVARQKFNEIDLDLDEDDEQEST